MNAKKAKPFDCVEMKRRIQEKIYAETKDMGPDELLEYFRRKVASSRFAPALRESEAKAKASSCG